MLCRETVVCQMCFLLLTDGISHAEEHFAGRHEGGGAVGEHADLKKAQTGISCF